MRNYFSRRANVWCGILCAVLISTASFATRLPLTKAGSNGAVAPAYNGIGDVVSGAKGYWGLRGYNAAYKGNVANICDALTGLVCADVTWNGTSLVVPTIGGLACDNSVNICVVATLYDQSGALDCSAAACDLTQSTNSRRPRFVVPGAANGCPTDAMYCMAFVRANTQCMVNATGLAAAAQPYSGIWTGIRTGNTTVPQPVIAPVQGAGGSIQSGWAVTANTIRASGSTTITLAANDNAWHGVQVIWSNTVGSLSADGATNTANTGTNTIPGATAVVIGSANASTCSNGVDGALTEAGVWLGAFTAQNITDLNSNQHTYWGF